MTTVLPDRSCARICVSASPPLAILIAKVHAAICDTVAEPCISAVAAALAQTSPAVAPADVEAEAAVPEPTTMSDPATIDSTNFTDMWTSQNLYLFWVYHSSACNQNPGPQQRACITNAQHTDLLKKRTA
jgi:hypothetical protein